MQDHSDIAGTGGFIGIPATVLTWLNLMKLVEMTPVLQFCVTALSFIWLVIQITGWANKRIKELKKRYAKK